MISSEYIQKVKDIVTTFDPSGDSRYFIFGSSVRDGVGDTFGDVDIGVVGAGKSGRDVYDLKTRFEDSTFPYFVDVVDIDRAKESFRDYVMNKEKKVWLN